jgi:GT2 family glycosyltransferase
MASLVTAPAALLRPARIRPAGRRRRPLLAVPRLSVVVVNYHQWHDTARLVRQLRTAPSLRRGVAEVVVVDNHSPPHPLVPRLRRLSGVSLRRWRRNRGFARAVNEGCRLSRGDWVLLLNPDMTLEPGFLDAVLARAGQVARTDPAVGIVGFRLRNDDGSRQLSTGAFPTLARTLTRLLLPRSRRKYTAPPGDARSPVDWVTGCCLLVRRACWEDLGGFDPDFFLYYEDVDLCRRARARGWTVWYEPALSAVHHHPLHARAVPAHLRLITRHALLTYGRKHWALWQFRILAGIVQLEARFRAAWALRRGDHATAFTFRQLGRIARCLVHGRAAAAGRCLQRVVRQQEECRASLAVRRHPQP